ncbi:MAG: hypothetical protein INR65_03525 [Gluconacetobacter diazotrophicus]|nr:hypothetical protein [Gluconacetobacter diazotrophicus]
MGMIRQDREPDREPGRPPAPGPARHDLVVLADWLAVSLMRRSCHRPGADPCPPWRAPVPDAMLRAVGTAFGHAHAAMLDASGSGLLVARPGAPALTRHERRLLRALAALQQDDPATADDVLFKLAPHPSARPVLFAALRRLADALSRSGPHGTALRVSAPALPAAVLPVLRRRGGDPRTTAILWPHPPGDERDPAQPLFQDADDAN